MKKAVGLVFIGGGIGALVRESLVLTVLNVYGDFPTSIFVANMTAAFLIGLVAGMLLMNVIGEDGKLFFSTGIMGGLSTFSTLIFGTETLLGVPGEAILAIVYLVLSMVIGLLLVEAGMWLGQRIGRRRTDSGTTNAMRK